MPEVTVNNRKATDDQFERASDLLGLNPNIREALLMPNRELTVEVPLRRDDGSIEAANGSLTPPAINIL
jgi:glutamate dehydrogenase (NAD(P)+)